MSIDATALQEDTDQKGECRTRGAYLILFIALHF